MWREQGRCDMCPEHRKLTGPERHCTQCLTRFSRNSRRYYQENREEYLAYAKRYYRKHRKRYLAHARRYYLERKKLGKSG